jgi:monofunctional biosynthetic peptidoglycan transglycosylase
MRQKIILGVSLLLFLPYALALIYPFMRPPSTLMLADWVSFHKVERQWVPLKSISPQLITAVVTAEDGAFCEHWGIDFRQMEKSIEKAQARNKPVKATSTITQQLAKNLFLWQGRSWMRKALEVPLTLWLELTWRKAWILEAYLNVAEWGEGVYGIEAAARHYYGTSAASLSSTQAALLAKTLPNPHERNPIHPGPAQAMMAGQLVFRMEHSAPDLSCIR